MAIPLLVCFVMLILLPLAKAQQADCLVFINELNVNGPESLDQQEFVEFSTNCDTASQAVSLESYTLVSWKGMKAKAASSSPAAVADLVIPLSGAFPKDSTYFVIGSNEVIKKLDSRNITTGAARFSNFAGQGNAFKTEKKNKHGAAMFNEFFTNGNGRAVALCLYRNVGSAIQLDSVLTTATANVDKLVDVVFYHSSGSPEHMLRLLLPQYAGLTGIEKISEGIVLKDHNTGSTDRSISYCCPSKQAKWPLAFKETDMTPREENSCEKEKFLLEKVTRDVSQKRCDFAAIGSLAKSKAASQGQPSAMSLQSAGEHLLEDSVPAIDDAMKLTQRAIKSTDRQVTVLASTVGTLVVVVGLALLGGGYMYIRQKKLRKVRHGLRAYRGLNMASSTVPESAQESEDELISRDPSKLRQEVEIH